jgi:hypothetical protein
MLDGNDRLYLTAKRRWISRRQTYELFVPGGVRPAAMLEVQAKGQQFTLKVPVSAETPDIGREILGIAKDRTHDGLSLPYFHLLLYYGQAPYMSISKEARMGALAYRDVIMEGGYAFRSKVPEIGVDKKPKRMSEIPEAAEESSKNVVFVDKDGVVVFKMYKMADQTMSVQTVPFIGPLVGFAIGLAVIH